MANYYLYRHIRLDKNEPFYIGIGTKPKRYNTIKQEYSRAYQRLNRNRYWTNITSLSDFDVEIMLESNDYQLIKNKEKEFIKLYGRNDLGQGTLANFTDGGDGTIGLTSVSKGKKSPERITIEGIEKMRKSKLGKPLHENSRKASIESRSKKVYQYSANGVLIREWFSTSEASRVLGLPNRSLCRATNGKNKVNKHFYKNYLWYYEQPK